MAGDRELCTLSSANQHIVVEISSAPAAPPSECYCNAGVGYCGLTARIFTHSAQRDKSDIHTKQSSMYSPITLHTINYYTSQAAR